MAKREFGVPPEDAAREPYSMPAEQAVLGTILLDAETWDLATKTLRPEMFFVRQNREIFTEMNILAAQSEPIDAVLLADRLARSDAFPNEGDARNYLVELSETVPSITSLPQYVELVYEKYIKRLLMQHAHEILEQTMDDADSKMMLDAAEQRLYEIRAGRDTSDMRTLKNLIVDIMAHLGRLNGPDREDYLGIPTGFKKLDLSLTGLGRSDLVILAARPGMGKTSFALNVATSVARREVPVAIFSLEMTKDQLAARILSSEAMVDSRLFRTGELEADDWDDMAKMSELLGPLPIFLDDSAAITIPEIKSKVRRLNNSRKTGGQKPVGLIIIDYLQLMSGGRRNENRVQEISEITRSLKIMAKDLDVPIITLSQLSRSAEKGKQDKRPMLSDLRDSGSIEQDADVVLFLYRDEYYGENNPEVEAGTAECIIAKNRHGDTGTVYMKWDAAHTRFYE